MENINWKDRAEKLSEIGDRMADELSVLAHTAGIPRKAVYALDDWDEMRFAKGGK